MGAVDFRVGGHIFATLASVKDGFRNLMLSPNIQADLQQPGPHGARLSLKNGGCRG